MALEYFSQVSRRLVKALNNPSKRVPFNTEPDWWIRHAMGEIYRRYGDVTELAFDAYKKFGESLQVQASTETTLMNHKAGTFVETYASGNTIDKISCTDSNYSGTLDLYYLTQNSGVFTRPEAQQVTITNGAGTLATPCSRVERIENLSAALTGDLYVYEDSAVTGGIPDDGTKVHLVIKQTENHSLKAAATMADDEYWVIRSFYSSINTKAQSAGVIRVRLINGNRVQETEFKLGITNASGWNSFPLDPYFLVPTNTDFLMTGTADQDGREMAAGARGVKLRVIAR